MNKLFESIRTEMELSAGKDAYLTGYLFHAIQKHLKYEQKEQKTPLSKKDGDDLINEIIIAVKEDDSWDIDLEINCWLTCALREIAKNLNQSWDKTLTKKFFEKDSFEDGEECLILEACCDITGDDPTVIYEDLLQVHKVCYNILSKSNTVCDEMLGFQKFHDNLKNDGTENEFVKKRIDKEKNNLLLSQYIMSLKKIEFFCKNYSHHFAGRYHLLWMMPSVDIHSHIEGFQAFYDYLFDLPLEKRIVQFVENMFPEKQFLDGDNLLRHSALHNRIIRRLDQAGHFAYLYATKNQNTFAQRNEIMLTHLLEITKRHLDFERNENTDSSVSSNGSYLT